MKYELIIIISLLGVSQACKRVGEACESSGECCSSRCMFYCQPSSSRDKTTLDISAPPSEMRKKLEDLLFFKKQMLSTLELCYFNPGDGCTWCSDDGIHWYRKSCVGLNAKDTHALEVCYYNSGDGCTWCSTDGVNWYRKSCPTNIASERDEL